MATLKVELATVATKGTTQAANAEGRFILAQLKGFGSPDGSVHREAPGQECSCQVGSLLADSCSYSTKVDSLRHLWSVPT